MDYRWSMFALIAAAVLSVALVFARQRFPASVRWLVVLSPMILLMGYFGVCWLKLLYAFSPS